MRTIKAFHRDEKGYYCEPDDKKFYYEEGQTYKMDKSLVKLCETGFHASANFDISETIPYYVFDKSYYGIVDLNVIETDNKKSVGDEITILEFLPKDFNVLSQYDKTGEWIYFAGVNWKQFNYELGLQKLSEIDKTGEWIYRAGLNWKQFDYELAFQKLLEIDKTGKWIYMAGIDWQEFDYETASKKLLQIDHELGIQRTDQNGKWIYWEGTNW